MNWQSTVERTVTGLGYDLVDAEKSAGGLLRVFIDHPATEIQAADAPEKFITVDDCEKVTRQLQHVLEVDDVAYERLEVSSPGLDRPLKKAADYARFVGEQVELTLKLPFQGRKKYRGELQPGGEGWRLLLGDATAGAKKGQAKKGQPGKTQPGKTQPGKTQHGKTQPEKTQPGKGPANKAEAKAAAQPEVATAGEAASPALALDFSLDEVRDAHLVPAVDFKGRRAKASPDKAVPAAVPRASDEVDGGRIQ